MAEPFLVEQWKWYAVSGWRIEMAVERVIDGALAGALIGSGFMFAAFATYSGEWLHAGQGLAIVGAGVWLMLRTYRRAKANALKCAERPIHPDNPKRGED